MKRRIHAIAGTVALATIVAFWLATVVTETLAPASIVPVKRWILFGMCWLVPAMMIVGGTGVSLAGRRRGRIVAAKRRRMPIVAANGLLVLVPCAFFLDARAAAAAVDGSFVAVQLLELVAGALNITLLSRSMRDGLRLTGRTHGP